eukprot:4271502-Pleurochrysis_carterae.AAC.1
MKHYDGSKYRLLSARKWWANAVILAKTGVRSGIGGLWGKGNENPARHAAQTPKCIRARHNPLLSATSSPTKAEVSRKNAHGDDFCPAPRPRSKV